MNKLLKNILEWIYIHDYCIVYYTNAEIYNDKLHE